jgi:hypothetical protein
MMKKVLMGILMLGMVSALSAADISASDAAFLFGNEQVNAVAMSSTEMVQTEGQLLGLLGPILSLVTGLVSGLPLVGPILGPLLDTTVNLVANLPIVGPLLF